MQSDRTVFECPVCRQVVTRPVLPLLSDKSVGTADGEPAVPEGVFAIGDEDFSIVANACPIVNLADLIGTIHHADGRRRNGCCGSDGLNGPNLLCRNGHEIGTEQSDCWMSHAAVLVRNVERQAVPGIQSTGG